MFDIDSECNTSKKSESESSTAKLHNKQDATDREATGTTNKK